MDSTVTLYSPIPTYVPGVTYNNTAALVSCFQTHSLEMLAAGVPLSTLTAMSWCTARSYVLAAPPTPTPMPASPPPAWATANMFQVDSGAIRGTHSAITTSAVLVALFAALWV